MFASDVYVSQPLTNVSVSWRADTSEYISTRAFPVVRVKQQSAKYWEIPKGAWFRSAAQKRGRGQESALTEFLVESKDAYYCDLFSLATLIDDRDRANAGTIFELDKPATEFLTGQIELKKEQEFITNHFTTGKWTTDVTPTVKWDQSAATIFADIRAGSSTMKNLTGKRPTKAIFQEHVWDVVQDMPDLVDRIKGASNNNDPAKVTTEQVATILGLDEVLIAGASSNTAKEGLADSFSLLAGKHVLLLHTPKTPAPMTPSAGYTFVWTDLYGVGPEGERVAKMREDKKRSDLIEAEGNWDHKLMSADLGVLIHDVLT